MSYALLLVPAGGAWRHSSRRYLSEVSQAVLSPEHTDVTLRYPNFSFEVKKQSPTTKARTGLIKTPHGEVNTPNFVFCATKAAMKSVTAKHFRQEGTEIILSNTYHLMLQPGSEAVEKLGGLQKMTAWNGPMLSDSGGYQIFSMGFGSVSQELKSKRDGKGMGWNKSLIGIEEEGAKFRSYVDGLVHFLTPEKCIDIQRQLGADLVVVLDECTPFNVERSYTEDSMRRSHRWAVRCLEHFHHTDNNRQALYGIVQGGIHKDLRKISADFVNNHSFFGLAIGGSLGASKREMHDIVEYTRSLLRDDRPVHLLGIGGIRDIFHGVRQGIDTFDCVHPTRLGRHGSALVRASFWNEILSSSTKPKTDISQLPSTLQSRCKKLLLRLEDRLSGHKRHKKMLEAKLVTNFRDPAKLELEISRVRQKIEETRQEMNNLPETLWRQYKDKQDKQYHQSLQSGSVEVTKESGLDPLPDSRSRSVHGRVREHVHLSRAEMREDPRPIDATCSCYTCRNFSRGYIHHLIKAGEVLGGTLVTIHNIAFMNRLMRDIRRGIAEDTLDEIEKEYIHPDIAESIGDTLSIGN